MSDTRYRKGREFAEDMACYMRGMAGNNSEEIDRLRRNVMVALREDVTPRQRECMLLYYAKGLSMPQIAAQIGVDKSTVSRTIKRGERRLRRCLRYGAGLLLEQRE